MSSLSEEQLEELTAQVIKTFEGSGAYTNCHFALVAVDIANEENCHILGNTHPELMVYLLDRAIRNFSENKQEILADFSGVPANTTIQ